MGWIAVAGAFRTQGYQLSPAGRRKHSLVLGTIGSCLHQFSAGRVCPVLFPYLLDSVSLSVPAVPAARGDLCHCGMEFIFRFNPDGDRRRGIIGHKGAYQRDARQFVSCDTVFCDDVLGRFRFLLWDTSLSRGVLRIGSYGLHGSVPFFCSRRHRRFPAAQFR